MLRRIYVLVLAAHPGQFRRRFGGEMLRSFDDALGVREQVVLLGDALRSLVRQWVFRPEYQRPPAALFAEPSLLFRTLDPNPPQRSVVLSGVGLAALEFGMVAILIGYGVHQKHLVVGAHTPGQGMLPVARESFEADLHTIVKIPQPPEDPLRAIAAVYFQIIRPLGMLDSDRDLVLSPWEVFTAPAALRKLDVDHDGKLSAEEMGFSLGSNSMSPEEIERARRAFVRENPALAALDPDQDGEVSGAEMTNSFRSLQTLDRNRDGRLTPDELIPDQQNVRAGMLFMKLDGNGDGLISREERESQEESSLRGLLQSADRSGDGAVTRKELQEELRLRVELKRQVVAARRSAGIAEGQGR